MSQSGARGPAVYFAVSFWAAFLLFSIQPIISKLLLPWFGGVAEVWIVNLVFFTSFLLLGYLYAHFLILKLQPKWQIIAHFAVIFVAGVGAGYEWGVFQNSLPDLGRQILDNFNFPVSTLLLVLLRTIGLPYFVLATTSPIIQAWYDRAGFGAPYKLYSVSNAGSLLAIVSYPLVIEPLSAVSFQTRAWLVGFLLFAILLFVAGMIFWHKWRPTATPGVDEPKNRAPLKIKLAWFGLALLPAMMLLTVTTRITKGIAAVPFLWLMPLAIYLITFIICFSPRKKIETKFFAFAFIICSLALLFLNFHFSLKIFAEMLVFGAAAMLAHAKLFELRPEAHELTRYYLYISSGGAVGSALVGLVAPVIFSGYYEYGLVLAATLALAIYTARKEIRELYKLGGPKMRWLTLFCLLLLILNWSLTKSRVKEETILRTRNFFGTLQVIKFRAPYGEAVRLMNGQILHGTQLLAADKNSLPTSYYSEDSGVGLLLRAKQKIDQQAERVGVVGLGAGTMAAYCRAGDFYTFFDINPSVVKIANRNFSFIRQCRERGGQVAIKIGDARLVLERELSETDAKPYDILVLDAFSDDAIPVHLLTQEAMNIYLQRLAGDGVLAIHISNRYLNLKPVLRTLAEKYGLKDAVVENFKNVKNLEKTFSSWVLLIRDQNILSDTGLREADHLKNEKKIGLWTDQFNNLLPLLK